MELPIFCPFVLLLRRNLLRGFMRYLTWLLRAILFLILFSFAVKNDQSVELRYFLDYKWEASLVLVLLLFFAVGTGVGALSVLGNIFRQRREIARLKRELDQKNKTVTGNE